jgi:hypothetical protein
MALPPTDCLSDLSPVFASLADVVILFLLHHLSRIVTLGIEQILQIDVMGL